jgi:hypothetical protein
VDLLVAIRLQQRLGVHAIRVGGESAIGLQSLNVRALI